MSSVSVWLKSTAVVDSIPECNVLSFDEVELRFPENPTLALDLLGRVSRELQKLWERNAEQERFLADLADRASARETNQRFAVLNATPAGTVVPAQTTVRTIHVQGCDCGYTTACLSCDPAGGAA